MSHLGFLSADLDLYPGAGLAGDGGARGAGHGDADLAEKNNKRKNNQKIILTGITASEHAVTGSGRQTSVLTEAQTSLGSGATKTWNIRAQY